MTPILVKKLQMDISAATKEPKWLLTDISVSVNIPKCFCSRGPPQPHWRSSQRSPDLLAGHDGHVMVEMEREDKGMEEGNEKLRLWKGRRAGE